MSDYRTEYGAAQKVEGHGYHEDGGKRGQRLFDLGPVDALRVRHHQHTHLLTVRNKVTTMYIS